MAADKGLFERIRKSFDSKRDEAAAIHPSENKKIRKKVSLFSTVSRLFKLVTQQQQRGRPSMNERTCAFFFLSVTAAAAATCPIKTRTEMKQGDN